MCQYACVCVCERVCTTECEREANPDHDNMKHHYFKGVILKACLLRNTEIIAIYCSNTSPFAFWMRLIFLTVILGGRLV